MTPHSRQAILEKAACHLEDRFEDISANLTREMGKPIGEIPDRTSRRHRSVALVCRRGQTRVWPNYPVAHSEYAA